MARITGNTKFRSKEHGKYTRLISFFIFSMTAVFVLTFGLRVYEKTGFPTLMATILGLLGVVAGTLVGHLVLIADEYRRLDDHYGGKRGKMIKACFSGIKWTPLVFILLVTTIGAIFLPALKDKPYFELSNLVYIFGGLGVGPLVMHLLQDSTQSEINISTILQVKETKPAHAFAWSYYLNNIRHASLEFDRAFHPFCSHKLWKLSSNKLLLLVSLGCCINDNLENVDDKIKKLFDIGRKTNSCCFSVYRLKVNQHETKYFAIQNVKEPLQTLRRMETLADAKAVTRENIKEELNTFYQKLLKILTAPPDESSKEAFILVPIKEENPESLNNGGLVKCIIDAVQRSETEPDGYAACFQCIDDLSYNLSSTVISSLTEV